MEIASIWAENSPNTQNCGIKKEKNYSATTPNKVTRQNYVQISEWKPLAIDFLQIMLRKLHTKLQTKFVTTLLF